VNERDKNKLVGRTELRQRQKGKQASSLKLVLNYRSPVMIKMVVACLPDGILVEGPPLSPSRW